MNTHKNDHDHTEAHSHEEHEYSLSSELACHLPYATFSVAISFILLSLLNFVSLGFSASERTILGGYHVLFHAFHYLHIVFATTGTLVAFSRYSKNLFRGVMVAMVFPAIFCTLSDVALPAVAGELLGLHMGIHICFFSLPDLMNVLPFMLMGLVTGFAIARHHKPSLGFVSLGSHFVHILISSLAAIFYVVSYGMEAWNAFMGMLFILLIVAVVVPCTISDVIIPMYFARCKRK